MRIAGIIAGVIIVSIFLWALAMIVSNMIKEKQQKKQDCKKDEEERKLTQQLAGVAPAVLRGDPLLPQVIDQGKRLQSADMLFSKLLAEDIFVLIPEEKKDEIRAWRQKYEQTFTTDK